MDEYDNLKSEFIIEKDSFQKEQLANYIKQLLNYCKIDNEGNIYFLKKDLTLLNKIMLTLASRFLGNKLNPKISPIISIDDLSKVTGHESNVVAARMAELSLAIKKMGPGVYQIAPFYIPTFLEKLEKGESLKSISKGRGISKILPKATNSEKQKSNKTQWVPDISEEFKKSIDRIEKDKHSPYFYNLPNWKIRALAILKIAKDELNIDGLTTANIYWIIREKFRYKCSFFTLSLALSKLDRAGYTDSKSDSTHPKAARTYKILELGEREISNIIEKLNIKSN